MFVQVDATHVENQIAVDHVAALVHGNAAVGVSIKGKAQVQALLHDMALEALDVGGATVDVDVEAVGGVVNHADVSTQGVKDGLCH